MRLTPGQVVLDRYEVEGLHDQGGMARVYRARNIKLGVRVALKVLTFEHDEELVERFNREAQMMARVHHPNIVQILDFGLVNGELPCIAMEYVDGEPLDMRLARRGALPWTEGVEVVLGILSGLDAIHGAGVLHRDLKPENIIVVPGEVEQPKLIDFGIALQEAAYDRKLTQVGETVGTPAYMSPEQLYGLPLDARSDVYSSALVLYELITQHLPNPGDATEALEMRVTNPLPQPTAPAPMPPIPQGLADAIFAALEPDPNNRPPSARAFANRLRKVRREARRQTASRARSKPRAPKPTPAASFGAVDDVTPGAPPATWKPPIWARTGSRGGAGGPSTSPPDGQSRAPSDRSPPSPRPDAPPNLGPTTADLHAHGIQQRPAPPQDDSGTKSGAGKYGAWAKAAGLGRPASVTTRGKARAPADSARRRPSTSPPHGAPDPSPGDASTSAPRDRAAHEARVATPSAPPQSVPTSRSIADRLADLKGGGSSQEPQQQQTGVRNRLLIVAIVPKLKLRLPSEVRWLEARCSPFGRGVAMAGKYFICTVRGVTDGDAEAEASAFRDALTARYGSESRASWAAFAGEASISPNSLPPIAQGLMHYMAINN